MAPSPPPGPPRRRQRAAGRGRPHVAHPTPWGRRLPLGGRGAAPKLRPVAPHRWWITWKAVEFLQKVCDLYFLGSKNWLNSEAGEVRRSCCWFFLEALGIFWRKAHVSGIPGLMAWHWHFAFAACLMMLVLSACFTTRWRSSAPWRRWNEIYKWGSHLFGGISGVPHTLPSIWGWGFHTLPSISDQIWHPFQVQHEMINEKTAPLSTQYTACAPSARRRTCPNHPWRNLSLLKDTKGVVIPHRLNRNRQSVTMPYFRNLQYAMYKFQASFLPQGLMVPRISTRVHGEFGRYYSITLGIMLKFTSYADNVKVWVDWTSTFAMLMFNPCEEIYGPWKRNEAQNHHTYIHYSNFPTCKGPWNWIWNL